MLIVEVTLLWIAEAASASAACTTKLRLTEAAVTVRLTVLAGTPRTIAMLLTSADLFASS